MPGPVRACPSMETAGKEPLGALRRRRQVRAGRLRRPGVPRTSGKDKLQLWYGNFYAAQTFSNTPDRPAHPDRLGDGVTFPGMPFNQQMTVPVRARPCATRKTARGCSPSRSASWPRCAAQARVERPKLTPGDNPLGDLRASCSRSAWSSRPATARAFELDLRGTPLVYDVGEAGAGLQGRGAPLKPEDGRVRLHVFLDRGSIEVFGNDGRVAMSVVAIPDQETVARRLQPGRHRRGSLTGRPRAAIGVGAAVTGSVGDGRTTSTTIGGNLWIAPRGRARIRYMARSWSAFPSRTA